MDSGGRNGFTLIELMVGVAVLAIALGAGVPSMSEFIKNSRLAAHTNDLLTSLHLARTEAGKRNARVTVCKSSDVINFDWNTTADTSWDIGWFVFVDTASFGTHEVAEVVFDTHAAIGNNVVIALHGIDVTMPNYT